MVGWSFASGQAAMMVGEWYEHPSLQDMEDDWGYCFFPKGPSPNAKMQTMFLGNIKWFQYPGCTACR